MLKFSLVQIETSLQIRFFLFVEIELLSIQKEENMKKVQVKNDVFYYEVSSKFNIDMIGIAVSM